MRIVSPKKRVTKQGKRAHAQRELPKADIREDRGVPCPDCREPMTQVLTVTTIKWECRCLPGIHFCE